MESSKPRPRGLPVKCQGCGYPIVGGIPGAVCPECGTTVALGRRAEIDTPIEELPVGTVWQFASALIFASAIMVGALVLVLGLGICRAQSLLPASLPDATVIPLERAIILMACCCWTFLAGFPNPIPQAEPHGCGYGSWLRRVVLWGSVIWVIACFPPCIELVKSLRPPAPLGPGSAGGVLLASPPTAGVAPAGGAFLGVALYAACTLHAMCAVVFCRRIVGWMRDERLWKLMWIPQWALALGFIWWTLRFLAAVQVAPGAGAGGATTGASGVGGSGGGASGELPSAIDGRFLILLVLAFFMARDAAHMVRHAFEVRGRDIRRAERDAS